MNEISPSRGIVYTFLRFLVIGIACLAVWWVGKYFIIKFGAPEIVMTIWCGIFILVGLVVFIDFLMGLVGRPFLNW
jgi:hypothetical protein